MTRFIAGLVVGGVMVGACWLSNRLAHYQLRHDMLEVYALASKLRAMQPAPEQEDRSERRDVGTYAARDDVEAHGEPCMLASYPPKPCSESGRDESESPKSRPYRLGAQHEKSRRYDPGGPWVDLPKPEISPSDRAELVKRLEARGGKNALSGG